jgi:hypothetical protein
MLFCVMVPARALEEHVQVSKLADAAGSSCPHTFAVGCILHVLTKVCAASKTIEHCHFHGECKKMRPVKHASRLFEGDDAEVWKCCCPPNKYLDGCAVAERDKTCVTAVQKRLIDRIEPKMGRLKKCASKKRQGTCEKAKGTIEKLVKTLQEVRERLRTSDPFCKQELAAPQPMSMCGWTVRPVPRSLGRKDLECEARRWQNAHNMTAGGDIANRFLCGGGDS